MCEIKLGKKSSLYPYLQILPEDLVPLCDWDSKVIAELQDEQFMKTIDEQKLEIDL